VARGYPGIVIRGLVFGTKMGAETGYNDTNTMDDTNKPMDPTATPDAEGEKKEGDADNA